MATSVVEILLRFVLPEKGARCMPFPARGEPFGAMIDQRIHSFACPRTHSAHFVLCVGSMNTCWTQSHTLTASALLIRAFLPRTADKYCKHKFLETETLTDRLLTKPSMKVSLGRLSPLAARRKVSTGPAEDGDGSIYNSEETGAGL